MTEFVFIRHGETDWNRQHRFQGQIDVPLNALGQTQAARLAERLRSERFDVVHSSDLQRALQTAAPTVAWHALPPTAHAGLREQGFGMLEGLDVPTIQTEHPALWAQWLRYEADTALPGGESVQAFHDRVLATVAQLAAQHTGQRVAVFTHGGVLDMLWRHAQSLPLSGPRECDIPNTGLNHLRWDGQRLHIEGWADAEHLQGLPAQPSTAPAGAGGAASRRAQTA
jgi:2,3-bisphosphoglycerate-dependent phosphoglycerate mutase